MTVEPVEARSRAGVPPRPPLPWSRFFGAVRIALDARKLILAILGLLLLHGGWSALNVFFLRPETTPITPNLLPLQLPALPGFEVEELVGTFTTALETVARPYLAVTAPFAQLFRLQGAAPAYAHAALAGIWAVLVWGIIGGAIARLAVLDASGALERPGISTALRFAGKKAGSLVGAPLSPFLALGFFVLLCVPIGLLYQLQSPTADLIAGVLLFLPLLAGLVMTLIVLGLAVGWPLMVLTIAAEGEDIFDALSRSYSYALQRPGKYLLALGLSWLIGVLGLLFVILFARLVVALAAWGLAFGAPTEPLIQYVERHAMVVDTAAGSAHGFWLSAVALFVLAWVYAYFWSAFAHIYLLLRLDMDGHPWHDVYLPEHDLDTFAPEPEPKPKPMS